MSATSYQKQSSECYDMIRIFLGKSTEQSNRKIFLKNSTKGIRSISRVLRNGHSMIGFLFWQKEEEPRKGFNTV